MKKKIIAAIASILTVFSLGTASKTNADSAATVNHQFHKEIVTFVDDSTDMTKTISSVTDEDYNALSRKWNGMPSVISCGGNIFVAWQTGGVREPDPQYLNYIVIAASVDGGVTWKDPFMVIDPLEDTSQAQVPMFYYNGAGTLNLLFSYSGKGIHSLPIYNADGALGNIYCGTPTFTGVSNSSFTKPLILSDKSIIYASGTTNTAIFQSKNDGATYAKISEIESLSPSSARKFAESSIVEKKDGSLWCLRRLENAALGGIEQSYSLDKGLTWSTAQGSLPTPLQSPGSRFTMQRLNSGNLLFITNAAGMGANRSKMTAYLSTDDGDSWQYSLILDPETSSYPDFYQASDGTIYIIFDKDRYGEGGIRLTVISEEDLKAGDYVSDKAARLLTVAKKDLRYADIKTVNGAFPEKAKYSTGTALNDILSKLPTQITVTDDNGKTQTLTGKYKVAGYNADKAGVYKAYFVTDLPEYLKDSFCKLEFQIELQQKEGCKSSVTLPYAIALALVTAFATLIIKKFKTASRGN